MLEEIISEIKEEEEEHLMIGGDFNARIGNEGGPIRTGEKKEEEKRRSKDKVINKEGRVMLSKIRERDWTILNGSYEKVGEWTYIGERGTLVIDYIVTNEKAIEEVKKVIEGNRTESDHVPLEMELEREESKKRRKKDIIIKERSVWSEEGVEHYHKSCEGWLCTQTQNGEIWRHLEEKVRNSMMKIKRKIISWKLGRRGWHSKEWKKKKKDLRRELRRMKKRKTSKEMYVKKRKEYREWYEEEREKYEKEEEEKLKLIGTEEEAWKYINKFRKKRERVNESIELENWGSHFMDLLRGTKERKTMVEDRENEGKKDGEEEKKEEEGEITKEELVGQIMKLKKGKAPGENEIVNEAWRLIP